MNPCSRVPLECDSGGFNSFKDNNLGNATELICQGTFEFEGFVEGHVCSEKAWCNTPRSYGSLVPTLPSNYTGGLIEEDAEIE